MKKFIIPVAIILVMAVSISLGLTVFAAGNTSKVSADTSTTTTTTAPSTTAQPDQNFKMGRGQRDGQRPPQLTDEQKAAMKTKMDEQFKTTLDQLVTEGKITQAEADQAYQQITQSTGRIDFSTLPQAVQDALKANREQGKPNLTEEQRTALKTATEGFLETELQTLVTNGTITQEQADAILNHSRDTFKSLTADQKTAIDSAHDTARKEAIDKLTQDGTITSDQATQLSQMPMHKGGDRGFKGGPGHQGGNRGMCPNGLTAPQTESAQ